MQVVIDVAGEAPQPTEQVLAVAKRLLVALTKGCLKAPVDCEVLGEEPHPELVQQEIEGSVVMSWVCT